MKRKKKNQSNNFYDENGVPVRCDCGRPPAIYRGDELAAVLRRMVGWNEKWETHIELVAKCSGDVCGWSKFTLQRGNADEGLLVFLPRAYESGIVQAALKQ